MVKKYKFKEWAIEKFWRDRGAAPGAIADAMDGFGSATNMTKERFRHGIPGILRKRFLGKRPFRHGHTHL